MNHTISIRTDRQTEFKEITRDLQLLVESSGISEGHLFVYVPHTTAAITINENADPDVIIDILHVLDKLVPLEGHYRHLEGNSAAHLKSSMIGSTEQLIIHKRKLLLGTWQGIYFCEFDGPRSRKVHIKITAA